VADVQLAKGYTKIANQILVNVAKLQLNGTQLRIILVIWRSTYGFNKKEHEISESFIVKATGISKRFVSSELKKLVDLNIIKVIRESTYTTPKILAFNKDFDTWKCGSIVKQVNSTSTVDVECASTVEEEFNSTVEQDFIQKINPLNKDLNKDIRPKKVFPDDSLEMHLSLELFNRIRGNNPKFKEPMLQTWCKNIELMLRIDKRTPEDIRQVIEFAQADRFWKSNVLSTTSLREQFDRLYMQFLEKDNSKSGKGQNVYEEVMKDLQNK
jgi:phage replication O-like protein O